MFMEWFFLEPLDINLQYFDYQWILFIHTIRNGRYKYITGQIVPFSQLNINSKVWKGD